jgi:hypothetical protein
MCNREEEEEAKSGIDHMFPLRKSYMLYGLRKTFGFRLLKYKFDVQCQLCRVYASLENHSPCTNGVEHAVDGDEG